MNMVGLRDECVFRIRREDCRTSRERCAQQPSNREWASYNGRKGRQRESFTDRTSRESTLGGNMAIATSVHTRLQKSDHVSEGTMAFHFVKPAGFDYQAGQSIDLTLLNPPETDAEGNTRTFTLASAPFDSDLMITTRMRDTAFKRVMGKASPGLEVKLEGPSGSF